MLSWSPGWHHNTPKEDYLGLRLAPPEGLRIASSSGLKYLRSTPAELKHYLDSPPTGKHLTVGDAGHAAVLEPDRFEEEFVSAGPCVAEFGSGPRKGEPCGGDGKVLHRTDGWYCGVHGKGFDEEDLDESRVILSADDFAMTRIWRHRCWEHAVLRPLLEAGGYYESVGMVTDADTGVPIKCRVDFLPKEAPIEIDLKTTIKPLSKHSFQRECAKYGYDLQGALYRRVTRQIGSPGDAPHREDRVIVAMSKQAPYLIRVFRLERRDLDAADHINTSLLEMWKYHTSTDYWPGYPDVVEPLPMPDWHYATED